MVVFAIVVNTREVRCVHLIGVCGATYGIRCRIGRMLCFRNRKGAFLGVENLAVFPDADLESSLIVQRSSVSCASYRRRCGFFRRLKNDIKNAISFFNRLNRIFEGDAFMVLSPKVSCINVRTSGERTR